MTPPEGGVERPSAGFGDLTLLLRRAGLRAAPVAFSVGLALAAAAFEGVSISLLIPFVQAVMSGGRSFSAENPGRVQAFMLDLLPPSESSRTTFAVFLFLIFSSAVLKNVLHYLSAVVLTREVTGFATRLRKTLFGRFLEFGKLFFDRTNVGQLHTVLVGHTATIAHQLLSVQNALTYLFIMIIYLGLMVAISWRLTLLVLFVFPVLYRASNKLVRGIGRESHSQSDSRKELDVGIFNVLSCMQLVKASNTEAQEKARFSKVSDEYADREFRMARLTALINPVQEIILLGMVLLLVAAMAWLVSREGYGRLAAYMVYFYILKKGATYFGFFNLLVAGLASISGELSMQAAMLGDEGKFISPDGSRRFEGLKDRIEFRGMSFTIPGGARILHDVSFSVLKGQLTAIVGPTGAGKTTLINLALKFYESPRGALFFDGVDVRELESASLRAHIAVVSQDVLLFNESIRYNVAYGHSAPLGDGEIRDALRQARLLEFVDGLADGLETRIGDRGVRLSGGERQRLSIARAILKKSDILILDEATSALDSQTEQLIQAAIEELVKGRTSIVIAHRLSTIKNADWIVVIDKGRAAEEGTLADLLKRESMFRRFWEQQSFY